MNTYTQEINKLYKWANENGLLRSSDESSFGFIKNKNKEI